MSKGMTFKEACSKAQPGQYIKAIGNSFYSGPEHYIKTTNGIEWSNGGIGGPLDRRTLESYFKEDRAIYGIYSQTNEYSRVS